MQQIQHNVHKQKEACKTTSHIEVVWILLSVSIESPGSNTKRLA